jgi:hypothetical protein
MFLWLEKGACNAAGARENCFVKKGVPQSPAPEGGDTCGDKVMARQKILNRCVGLMLCLMMTLSLMPAAVLADAGAANEAKIGDTEYATLTAAIAAVENSEGKTGTIVLLKDIALGSVTDKANHYLIPAGVGVTLDLAGHRVSATDDTGSASGGYYLFENQGTFTVEDSSGNDSGEIAVSVGQNRSDWMETTSICNRGGVVYIRSGTISAARSDTAHLSYAVDNLTYTGDTQMVISGGKLTSNYNVVRVYNQNNWASNYKVENDCSLTISGGTFESLGGYDPLYLLEDQTHHGKMTVTIDNGTFSIQNASRAHSIFFCDNYDIDSADSHKITITVNGGTYSERIQNIAQYYYDVDGIGTVTVNGGTFSGNNPIHGGNTNYGLTVTNNTSYQIGVTQPDAENYDSCYIPVSWPYYITYPAAGADADNDNKPDQTTDTAADGKTVTVDPNGGTWRESADKTVFSLLTANLTLDAPVPSAGKVFVGWTSARDDGGNYTYTAQYEDDAVGGGTDAAAPDGIPDKYQAKVTWKAVNAAFADNGKTIYTQYVTLTDGTGKWSTAGSAVIAAGRTAAPDPGYKAGSYDKVFSLTVNGETTITYTAVRRPVPVIPGDSGAAAPSEPPEVKPPVLNTEDHFAYIIGYPDGTVRPNANISRAEVATIFFRLLNNDVRTANWSSANSFSDVNGSMWCNNAISTLAGMGILKGYSDGTFRPNAPITRAEYAAIASRFDALTGGTASFSDVASDHWAYDSIVNAAAKGWVNGYPDGTFKPDKYITRAEAMKLTNKVLNRSVDAAGILSAAAVWPDNLASEWYYFVVEEATNSHVVRNKAQRPETWSSLKDNPDWKALEDSAAKQLP